MIAQWVEQINPGKIVGLFNSRESKFDNNKSVRKVRTSENYTEGGEPIVEILEQLSAKDQLVVILCSLGVTINVTGALLIGIFGEEIGPTGAMFIKIWMVDLGWAMCAMSSIIALFF